MPTLIESGSGKPVNQAFLAGQMFLAPVPGLVVFSERPGGSGGGAGDPELFGDVFYSDSCNYGLTPMTNGQMLLITDTLNSEADPTYGPYLKLVIFNADGTIASTSTSSTYSTNTLMRVYNYDGFAFVGPVDHLATGNRHLIKIDADTQAVTFVASLATNSWQTFSVMADESRVIISPKIGVDPTHVVFDLDDGSTVQTVALSEKNEDPHNRIVQSAATGDFLVSSKDATRSRRGVLTCDETTGTIHS